MSGYLNSILNKFNIKNTLLNKMCGIWLFIDRNKKYTLQQISENFHKIKHRGPDTYQFLSLNIYDVTIYLGFHRLSIMDVSSKGDQPFHSIILNDDKQREIYTMVNGEIYNFKQLKKKFKLDTTSDSDCEVVHQLYIKNGFKSLIEEIEGEFSGIILEKIDTEVKLYIFRDHLGVRPLFYGIDDEGDIAVCSELKGIHHLVKNIKPVKPNSYITLHSLYTKKPFSFIVEESTLNFTGVFTNYYSYSDIKQKDYLLIDIHNKIYHYLTNAVKKRLMSDRPIGFCLSGGLDSSLICGIASNILGKINTFTIAFKNSEDLINSRKVAEYIKSNHKEFIVTPEECLKKIEQVIYQNETYDCTTIRASVFNRMLVEKIKETNEEIKVLFVGEYSDELSGGYSYFHNSPDEKSFHKECVRLLEDIYLFDSLRCDRSIASQGIEARVPFSDKQFIEFYLSIDPKLRMPRYSDILGYTHQKIEKALIREAFYCRDIIPNDVIKFKKMAFSDQKQDDKRWYQYIQEYIDTIVGDEEFNLGKNEVQDTKEKYYYKKVFTKFYGENKEVTPYMWLPKWCVDNNGKSIKEPSATVLSVFK